MPNSDNARRSMRKKERRRIRNRMQRSALRTAVKKVRLAAASTDIEAAKSLLASVIKTLDQAADKHLIHKNKAARDKSRLTRLVNKLTAQGSKPAASGTP